MALIALLFLLSAGAYWYYKKQYGPNTYMPPAPTVERQDLNFGYYLSDDESIQEIANHSTFIFEPNWGPPEGVIRRAELHNLPIVLTCTKECFGSFESNKPAPDCHARLDALFSKLQSAGILSRVSVLYPIDEPDGRHVSHEDMAAVVDILRSVAQSYPELANVKIGVIYSTHMTYPGIEQFDLIGLDKYGMGSNVLISREFKELKRRRQPHQKIWLVPGGADPWQQDPQAFERYAHLDADVWGIVAFLWIDYFENGALNKGIGSNAVKGKYIALGQRIK